MDYIYLGKQKRYITNSATQDAPCGQLPKPLNHQQPFKNHSYEEVPLRKLAIPYPGLGVLKFPYIQQPRSTHTFTKDREMSVAYPCLKP